jgi:galactosyltransferase
MVYKELAALFWIRLYCPLVRFLFRIDDDVLLDIFLLINHIQHDINFNDKDGIFGWFRLNSPVLRSGRWAVTTREYQPSVYPPYTYSTGYLFSNQSCQRFVDAANHLKQSIIPVGDAYITGILRDLAQIPYYTYTNLEHIIILYNELPCDTHFERRPRLLVCTSKLHSGIRGDPYEYYDAWDNLLLKHNKTIWTI